MIAGIAANLNGEYPQRHAVHIRLLIGRCQLLAGHHHIRAAKVAGITEIWAWAEEMDDEETYMQLVIASAQGEVAPLEVGRHAMEWKSTAGLASKGKGLRGYLSRIGPRFSERYLGQSVQAAEVYEHLA